MSIVSIVLVVSQLLLAAPNSRGSAADESPEAKAAAAKARGDAALIAGRPAEALREYEAASQIVNDAALLYNRGRALQALERYPEAARMLDLFAMQAAPELRARVPKLDALLVEVRSKSSALELTCNVPGAEVHVEQLGIGQTPLHKRIDWNAGKVTVRVTHAGYHPWQRVVDLPAAGVAVVEVALAPESTTGLLLLESVVPGAAVTIDGQPKGTVPFEGYLAIGTHRVEVTAEGYEPGQSQVVIAATDPRKLNLDLAPTPRFYQRWYFWGAVVAVIGAGVATGVALTTERPAVEGTLGITTVGAKE